MSKLLEGASLAIMITVFGVLMLVMFLLSPIFTWLGWNVLGFGEAVGLGPLGFWGIILLAIFLAGGFFSRLIIVSVLFIFEPSWFADGVAEIHWPDPTSFKVWLSIVILLLVASSRPSGSSRSSND